MRREIRCQLPVEHRGFEPLRRRVCGFSQTGQRAILPNMTHGLEAVPDAFVPDAFVPDAFVPDAFVPDALWCVRAHKQVPACFFLGALAAEDLVAWQPADP
jgi:hypothetical protein